ncbi:MAG: beta-ketoacyl-[acyl-carrier-protein] synthase family protein [bacterium]
MNALRQVVITGAGVVSALGLTPAELYDNLLAGRSAVGPFSGFDTSAFPCHVAAPVTGYKARQWIDNKKNLKLMSRAVQFGMGALKMAHTAGRLQRGAIAPERIGLFVGAGTAVGRTDDLVPAIQRSFGPAGFAPSVFGDVGMHAINPLWLLKGLSNNVLGFGSADIDARGINQNYCNSGVGGLQAIGEAAWAIVEGKADVIIAGGADSSINVLHFTGFGRLRALTSGMGSDAVRPYDARHDGFAPGEGAAFFVLETEAHARARGVEILARIVGYGDGCGAHALSAGDLGVITAACRRALERAGWAPDDVDLIYAHGNGTPVFDRREAEAFRAVFGNSTPPVTTNKAQLGHPLAAGGPISVACALEAGRRDVIAAVPHVDTLDPACAHLDLVRGEDRRRPVRRALVHAAGLGAQTTFLALEFAS